MITKETKDNWDVQKNKLKAKYPNLSDVDLHFARGKKNKMNHNIQTKIGK